MPLSGLRVVELGALPAASYCARLFADFGAEVLKVEPPGGDPGRLAAPLIDTPGGRESGAFGFLNFNKSSLVIDAADGTKIAALGDLVRGADVLVDALDAAGRQAHRIDHAALRREHPNLIILSMSWFGESGPYQSFRGTDAVCRALAGLVQLIGPKEGPPVPVPDHQAGPVGGLTAFIAAMATLLSRQAQHGRTFEVGVLDANLALSDYNVALAWAAGGRDQRWGINRFPPNYPLGIFRCKRGWIGITVVTPVQWKTFCQMLGMPDLIGDPRYAINRDRLRNADAIEKRFAPRFLERTAEEWFTLALEQRMPFVVVPDMADLLDCHEHRRRNTFVRVAHGGRSYELPGSPLRLSATPPRAGGVVPALGQGKAAWSARTEPGGPAPARPVAGTKRPLEGFRVIDLSMGWAGPLATRHLADLGCDIIKVEACQYPDWWRGVDNRPIVIEQVLYEKSAYFNVLNRNKRGVTLDLTTADGVRLVKELVRGADAVIENYSVGVLPKLGLDYDNLRKVNPSLVMVSMPAFAADGAWGECRAYGSTLEQASGLPSISGRPDGPPTMNHIAYGDPIGGLNAAAAMLVALAYRRRTGEGQRIDLSQVECMFTLVAPWIVEQSANGKVAPRLGGRHRAHVPHGCFPCQGEDAWVLVAVEDDRRWLSLCAAIDRDDLARDPALASAEGRRGREDEIEEAIAEWTRKRTSVDAMHQLQHAGVAAGMVRPPLDLLHDPHLEARGSWQWIERAFVGKHAQPSPAYREDGRPYTIVHPAPTLGQHNEEVLKSVLGLTQEELDRLARTGVIGTQAVPPSMRKARAAVG